MFKRKLENVLFFYGFQRCNSDQNFNFLKINENDYLIFRIFRKNTADLSLATYKGESNPCQQELLSEKTVKLSFDPNEDLNILKNYITK